MSKTKTTKKAKETKEEKVEVKEIKATTKLDLIKEEVNNLKEGSSTAAIQASRKLARYGKGNL